MSFPRLFINTSKNLVQRKKVKIKLLIIIIDQYRLYRTLQKTIERINKNRIVSFIDISRYIFNRYYFREAIRFQMWYYPYVFEFFY